MSYCSARTGYGISCMSERRAKSLYCAKHHAKDLYLLRTYGISIHDAEEILSAQNWCCPVCYKALGDAPEFEPWVIDHSHRQKRVRGILSRHCNHRVVGRHEDWQVLDLAQRYLRDPPAYRVLSADQRIPVKKRKKRNKAAPAARTTVRKRAK